MVASGCCLHIFLRRMALRPASHGYLSQGHHRSWLVRCSEALVLSELIPSIIEPIPLLSTQAQVEPDWNWNYLLANSRATNKAIGTRRTLALPTAKATTDKRRYIAKHRTDRDSVVTLKNDEALTCRISNNDCANGLFKYKGVQIYDSKGGLTVVLTPQDRFTRSSPSPETDCGTGFSNTKGERINVYLGVA